MKITFAKPGQPARGTLVVLANDALKIGPLARGLLAKSGDLLARAAKTAGFKGAVAASLDIVAPAGLDQERLLVIGTGKAAPGTLDWQKIGGAIQAKIRSGATEVTIVAETADGTAAPEAAVEIALGLRLGAYRFDRYKTKKKPEEEGDASTLKVTIALAGDAQARKLWKAREAVADGVDIARDLVNEPPNVLDPAEFAARAAKLTALGVTIETLDEKAMKKLGMNALLGVAQGSAKPPRLVVMQWNGGKKGATPVAFVGKGVVFDTGGISIKPAQGMEDMKGDMAGAACVVGLMHALASRKAKVNAVGVIGLVENMPDGNAQRPGDIVTSMSGQTIEIINTDAEGRLVLADALWYTKQRFKPAFMVDLATLTGAIIIALGDHHAGLFSNCDQLAERLTAAGVSTGERVWRMPLGADYDKQIDSKFADMKNSAGRQGSSITAAQFLQRFVDGNDWAHLDIAGTGMAGPQNDLNRSWGPGWGVRLLDQLVSAHYER